MPPEAVAAARAILAAALAGDVDALRALALPAEAVRTGRAAHVRYLRAELPQDAERLRARLRAAGLQSVADATASEVRLESRTLGEVGGIWRDVFFEQVRVFPARDADAVRLVESLVEVDGRWLFTRLPSD